MASIVTNNDKIPKKLLNELNKNLNKIEEVMNENGHTNLRTFQFYLSKLNLLYQVIKDEVYNNEEVYKKINIEILEACMKLKREGDRNRSRKVPICPAICRGKFL